MSGSQQPGENMARCEEHESDEQARPPLPHHLLQFAKRDVRAIRKIMMKGLHHELLRISKVLRPFCQMDDDLDWLPPVPLLRPAHDELLGIVIQIPLMER